MNDTLYIMYNVNRDPRRGASVSLSLQQVCFNTSYLLSHEALFFYGLLCIIFHCQM